MWKTNGRVNSGECRKGLVFIRSLSFSSKLQPKRKTPVFTGGFDLLDLCIMEPDNLHPLKGKRLGCMIKLIETDMDGTY